MTKTLIIPGYKGSDEGHWQRHWLDEDSSAILVAQPDWHAPDLDQWTANLVASIYAHPQSVLVAHSLGVPLVVHAAKCNPLLPVKAALLVAPADVDRRVAEHPGFASFVPLPMQPLPFESTVVASRNDPFIDFGRAAQFAWAWDSEFVDLGQAGHINIESGFGPWPEGRALISKWCEPERPRIAHFAQGIGY